MNISVWIISGTVISPTAVGLCSCLPPNMITADPQPKVHEQRTGPVETLLVKLLARLWPIVP